MVESRKIQVCTTAKGRKKPREQNRDTNIPMWATEIRKKMNGGGKKKKGGPAFSDRNHRGRGLE